MANNGLNTVSENILSTKCGENNNVVIIDPNKIVNSSNGIVDRYVNQEDLIIYANLKIINKPQTTIVYNNNTNTGVINKTDEININLLNPIKSVKGGVITYKNKLTSDYTDYFTESKINNNLTDDETYFDPETFGINNIIISQNASFIPTVTIEFIDIQGRTLFESGDNKKNPYNIFYTLPYPTFILSIKGYYGKTIDYPLVLLKTNTKFDPESGNYKITAEFLSRTFSIYNSFLLIYAYIAPFMFKMNDGSFLGGNILKKIYDIQNKYYEGLPNSEKYIIKNYPTLLTLQEIKKSLSVSNEYDNDINNANNVISNLDNTVFILRQYYDSIVRLLPLTDNNRVEVLSDLSRINEYINNISDKSTSSSVFNYIQKTAAKYFIDSKLTIDVVSDVSLFNNLILGIIKTIDDIKSKYNETILNKKLVRLSDKLGFQPNVFNIYRILFNNIQTFLILLNIANKKAIHQILNDVDDLGKKRIPFQDQNGEYTINNHSGTKKYSPFPNYFVTETKNGVDNVYKKTYPGIDIENNGWAEVEFIDEIYNSISYLKSISGQQNTELLKQTETVLNTNFDVGFNLENYSTNDSHYDILYNIIRKFQLNYIYSGMIYRGIKPDKLNDIFTSIADSEFSLLNDVIFNKVDLSTKRKTVDSLFNDINDTKPYNKIVSNITSGIKSQDLNKLKDEINFDILIGGKNIKKILKKYSINTSFMDIFLNEGSPVFNKNNELSITPIFDFETYKSQDGYYIPDTTMSNFIGFDKKILAMNNSLDNKTNSYVFGTENNKIISDGVTKNTPYRLINNYIFNEKISSYDKTLNTLTMTVNDKNILLSLIGFDNEKSKNIKHNTNINNKF